MPDRLGREPHTGGRPAAVVVLAAGEGRRMRSAVPKLLHPIAGRSLLAHAVYAVAGLRPEHLVAVIGHARERIGAELMALSARLGRPVLTAVQDKQLGTGHAVRCGLAALPDRVSGPVLVSCGDVPLLEPETLHALLAEHRHTGAAVTLLTTEADEPTGYGRVLRAPAGTVTGIVEQADATPEQLTVREVNSGVYVFDGEFLGTALHRLDTANNQGEFYLTDLVAIACTAGAGTAAVRCTDPWQVHGVNDRLQLAGVRAELNRRLLRRWMLAGVTVVDPATTWVDMDVALEPDVVLHPGTHLHGTTLVQAGAEVGPDTTLADCTIGAGAVVLRTHGSGATVGSGARVGPFAYLRPGARLGDGGKIGTFVEVKNADIGAGSKVPHLTYVGDATIGEQTNIGASSVFVNYDGVRKHRTEIGSHVRTGSDTMFIAPVRVGDGAYTGAGTVLRADVPPGALAVSAGAQRTIEGWVGRNRPGSPAAEAAARVRTGGADQPDTEPNRKDGA